MGEILNQSIYNKQIWGGGGGHDFSVLFASACLKIPFKCIFFRNTSSGLSGSFSLCNHIPSVYLHKVGYHSMHSLYACIGKSLRLGLKGLFEVF